MRKIFSLAVAVTLVFPLHASAAPKVITIKDVSVVATDIQSDGITNSGANSVTFLSTASSTLDITLTARNTSGSLAWSKVIDSGQNELAMVSASDNAGNIWLAGVSNSIPVQDTSTPVGAVTNPDGVVIETLPKLRKDLDQVTLWNLSASGDLLATYSFPLKEASLINAISVDSKGVSVAGARSSGAFVLSASLTGVFGKLTKIGTSKTSISAISRNSDGSVSAFGSSSETLGGKKLVGAIDGVLIKISKSAVVSQVVRSSAPKAKRNWSSATATQLLVGEVIAPKGNEIAITKFTPQFVPTWTTRFAIGGKGLGVNLPRNSYAVAFVPSSLPKGLAGQKLAKGQGIILLFDSKGVITAAYANAAMGAPLAASFSADGGINLLAKGVGTETLSIFHLNSR
jgi:hypothetical protein